MWACTHCGKVHGTWEEAETQCDRCGHVRDRDGEWRARAEAIAAAQPGVSSLTAVAVCERYVIVGEKWHPVRQGELICRWHQAKSGRPAEWRIGLRC